MCTPENRIAPAGHSECSSSWRSESTPAAPAPTTGGSFWEFDCFTVQKRSSFGTQSSPRRTFLAGRRSGRLEGRFPPARLLTLFARDLLVAAGEQEDFHSFFAPQQPGAAFGNLTVSLSKKGHLLGHSPHPGGLFWRAAEAD